MINAELEPQAVTLDESSFDTFLELAEIINSNSPQDVVHPFTLEALARTVDVAYNQGRLAQLEMTEGYDRDPEMQSLGARLTENIEQALTYNPPMPDEAYDDGEVFDAYAVAPTAEIGDEEE